MKSFLKLFLNSLAILAIGGLTLVLSDIIAVEVIKQVDYTHLLQFAFTIALILILSKGKMSDYGFSLPKNIPYRSLLFLVVGVLFLSTISKLFIDSEIGVHPLSDRSFGEKLLRAVIYASILEEIFFRGLIQSFLSKFKHIGIQLGKTLISYPVIFTSLLFTIAHLPMLFRDMNTNLGFIVLFISYVFGASLVMGYAREKSESLIPALAIHVIFNLYSTFLDLI